MRYAICFLLLCAGCTSNVQTVTQAAMVTKDVHDVYDLTLSALTELRHAGIIDDETKVQIEKVRLPVYDAINRMDNAVLAGDMSEFTISRQAYNLAIPALRDWLFKLRQKQQQPLRSLNHVGSSSVKFAVLGSSEQRQSRRPHRAA